MPVRLTTASTPLAAQHMDDAEKLFNEVDHDSSGYLSRKEMLRYFARSHGLLRRYVDWAMRMRPICLIPLEEVVEHITKRYHASRRTAEHFYFSMSVADAWHLHLDTDGSGKVSKAEYVLSPRPPQAREHYCRGQTTVLPAY